MPINSRMDQLLQSNDGILYNNENEHTTGKHNNDNLTNMLTKRNQMKNENTTLHNPVYIIPFIYVQKQAKMIDAIAVSR